SYALTVTSAVVLCGAAAAQAPSTGSARGPAVQVTKALGPGEKLASNLIGATVKSTQGQNIGEVSDLVVNDKNDVVAAVVSVGGVLGVGQKKIGVRYQDFEVSPDGRTLYLNMNQEQLEQQAPFDDTVTTSTAAARNRTVTPQQDTARNGAAPADARSADTRSDSTPQRDSAGDRRAGNAQGSSSNAGRTLKSGEQGAKALIGAEVVDKTDSKVGKIRDLIVAPGKEEVQAVVALGGGPAFASSKLVTIPLDNLKIVPGKDRASEPDRVQAQQMTETQIASLPEFHYE
ncbi:MAG TPA: PRC-barrel domain-containing protein, partial [Gammaproteobacteria bacterium]|nr:PRC-barrel domain-containing protein [Gammaproteobacteria bacterium]